MKGSCLCGQVEYQVKKLNSPIKHCSCKTCRKAHSAAFNTAAAVLKEDFCWVKGESLLSAFESSPGKIRLFCSNCGTQLIKKIDGKSDIVLRVASLDDDPGQVPELRIWCSDEVPWLDYTSAIPRFEEWDTAK